MHSLTALGACVLSCILRLQGKEIFSFSLFNLLFLLIYLAEFILRLLVKCQTGNTAADKMTAKLSANMSISKGVLVSLII